MSSTLRELRRVFHLVTVIACLPASVYSQVVQSNTPITDPGVYDIAKAGNTVFLAGTF